MGGWVRSRFEGANDLDAEGEISSSREETLEGVRPLGAFGEDEDEGG